MKWIAHIDARLSFDVEIDTDEHPDFDKEEGGALDPNDKDEVHDMLVDLVNDEDFIVEHLSNNGFSIDQIKLGELKRIEPKKEG